MIASWIKDIGETANEYADDLLQHFYRWLCARESLLHDSALRRVVTGLMRKVSWRAQNRHCLEAKGG